MTIKAIAVDMDGTFLNSQSDYDHDYFAKVYDLMVAKGVQFVVASGNPHYQLEDRFPTVKDQLAFVAENGVELMDHGELVYCGEVAMETVERVNALHQAIVGSHFIISAYDTAYTFKDEDPAFVEHAIKHYPHMKRIDSLSEVDDKVTKMMMDVLRSGPTNCRLKSTRTLPGCSRPFRLATATSISSWLGWIKQPV